jgi:hypothetical protein
MKRKYTLANGQFNHDNAIEHELSADEELFESQCQRADELVKELKSYTDRAAGEVLNYLSEELNDEEMALFTAIVERSLNEYRHSPINQLVNMALEYQSLKYAKEQINE